jgi:hypothetical protein
MYMNGTLYLKAVKPAKMLYIISRVSIKSS